MYQEPSNWSLHELSNYKFGRQSFCVTNFPESVWNACSGFGNVFDLFISNNKSILGKCLGFVRFKGVHNLDDMVNSLCGIWFRYCKLFASLPRFDKKRSSQTPHFITSKVVKQDSHGNSYASVLKGSF
ncbi:unnamed protein product [Lactuca saligna]|uniref:RRM domain-containing protein n=1 Tax=Lactuca saligna TaxID=75948 RepID=A0AA35Z6X6_LACSI|nr:unnamed protein product [Lactuca saligna]